MYHDDRQRMKDRIACDMLLEAGKDMLFPVKELMKFCPGMSEKSARYAVSRWLVYEYRREVGLRSMMVVNGELPKSDIFSEYEDFAPVGMKRCPDRCYYGKITIQCGDDEVQIDCESCEGKGFLKDDNAMVIDDALPVLVGPTGYEDFAPIGMVKCPNECDYGKFVVIQEDRQFHVECEACGGKGFVPISNQGEKDATT